MILDVAFLVAIIPTALDVSGAVARVARLSKELHSGAIEFEGVVLGVLIAVFIARVFTVEERTERPGISIGGPVLLGHGLAAVILSTSILVVAGVLLRGQGHEQVWFATFLAGIAFLIAWWIDAGVALLPETQIQRTTKSLEMSSWQLHRCAAMLRQRGGRRRLPRRKVALVVASTAVIATAASLIFVLLGEPAARAQATSAALFLGGAALWATFFATLIVWTTALPEGRTGPTFAWVYSVLFVAVPVGLLCVQSLVNDHTWRGAALLVSAVLPFLHTLDRRKSPWSLRTLVNGAQLRSRRLRRLVLLRDLHALRAMQRSVSTSTGPPTPKVSRRPRFLSIVRRRRAATDRDVRETPLLQMTRPPTGPGSDAWWHQTGRPRMYLPH